MLSFTQVASALSIAVRWWRSRIIFFCLHLGLSVAGPAADGQRYAMHVLTQMVRPGGGGAGAGEADLARVAAALEVSEARGLLALLHLTGVPDEQGRLAAPGGWPRDLAKALRYATEGASRPHQETGDGWSFTVLGLLLSINYAPLRCLRLEVLPGPSVHFHGLEEAVKTAASEGNMIPKNCKPDLEGADLAGAAYWAAAERREPLGSVIFASLLRRNLTDVPQNWYGRPRTMAERIPLLLAGKQSSASSDLACRAIGSIVQTAAEASSNEEPLLDKAALSWKAWRHKARRPPEDPEWKLTKEYVDTVKFRAEELKEPVAARELGAVHYEGHSEAGVAQSRATATEHWQNAAQKGDIWSAWYTALVKIQEGNPNEASDYLDQVASANAGALTFMALHFKHRFGLGVPKNPQQAGMFLKGAADFGYSNAQVILAHAYLGHTHGNMEGVEPPGGRNSTWALAYYKAAAENGRLGPKFNVGLLTAQGHDLEIRDPGERCLVAYKYFTEVVLRAHPLVHLLFAHARRAYDLRDDMGSLLRFLLLSDAGALNAHVNAAFLWEKIDDPNSESLCWEADATNISNPFCAFYYYRRAASSGHVPSMHEVSHRHLEAQRVPKSLRDAGVAASYEWTTLAADQGDARGLFNLAYMTQFGQGVAPNITRAEEIYWQLLQDGDWVARVAALSGLGMQRLHSYFVQAKQAMQPAHNLLTAAKNFLLGWASSSFETVASYVRMSSLEGVVVKDPFQGPDESGTTGTEKRSTRIRKAIGRLVFEIVGT